MLMKGRFGAYGSVSEAIAAGGYVTESCSG